MPRTPEEVLKDVFLTKGKMHQPAGAYRSLQYKEELAELTGRFPDLVILAQMIYWTSRTKDFGLYEQEEMKRARLELDYEHRKHGWIFKSAAQMSEELCILVKREVVRRAFKRLVESGLLSKQMNPDRKSDHTYHYRVDLIEIHLQLIKLGYWLTGYKWTHPIVAEIDVVAHEQLRLSREEGIKVCFGPAIDEESPETPERACL